MHDTAGETPTLPFDNRRVAMARPQYDLQIEVESQRVERRLVDFAAEVGKSVAEILPQQAGLFVKEVIKLTPPLEKLSVTESFATQKRIGERAVEREIRSAFVPLDRLGIFNAPENEVTSRKAKDLLRRGGPEALAAMMRNAGYEDIRGDRVITAPTEDLHNPLRGSRGKVLRSRKRSYFVRTEAAVRKFVKVKQGLVGKMKAGWLAAADALGVRGIPAWIRRHPSKGSIFKEHRRRSNPFIKIVNAVSYASRQNADLRFVAVALRNRGEAIRRQLEAKARGAWRGRGA